VRVPAMRNVAPRTQASLAVRGDGERWFLINASPDLRQQIEARHILHPAATCVPRRSRASSSPARMSMRLPACCICGNVSLSRSAPASACSPSCGTSDFRRIGGGLRAPAGSAPWPIVRAAACRRQLQRTFRSNCFDVPGKSRSTFEPATPPKTFRPAGRHGRPWK